MSVMDLPEFEAALMYGVEALREGLAVVVANPSPMTYGVIARDARVVNRLKGRPADHPVGVSVHTEASHDRLFRCLDLRSDALAMVDFALAERITVLAPVRPDPAMPEWLAPAIKDGWVLFFDGSWGPTWFLWESHPFLYGSSANRTGEAPAASAAEAREQFPARSQMIIDADDRRLPATAYGPSTIIRVARDGRPTLHRSGIQDPDVLLNRLREFRSKVAVLDGSTSSPLGRTYLSVAVNEDGTPKQLLPNTRIRLGFARQPNKNEGDPRVWDIVRAHVGCNRIGTATAAGELLAGGRLSIPGLGGTAVGCKPPLRDQEELLTAFLTSNPTWQLNGDELTLTSGGTTITLLDRKIVEPDSPLDGVKWTVVTTIANADARRGYGRREEAWIRFDDGRLTGWTGGNDLTGTFTRNNTELSFTDVTVSNRPGTAETAAMETAMLATFQPTVSYTIDHNQLTLLAQSSEGLDLTTS
ncbi:META domain-containing protein [Kribbella sp. GL6]|uniref:META domain-containing protein n=1 Tax=Kribbella sp. GL6 TaxID=3419765 RepID=UPI003CFE09E4